VTDRLLTAREVADRVRVEPATVLRWRRKGKLFAVRLPSGQIRFPESKLDAALDSWADDNPPIALDAKPASVVDVVVTSPPAKEGPP
jgi:excisionase family DNA binding protein